MNDRVNGIFEFVGGCLILLNCWRLYKDKCVRGWNLWSTAFFAAWGFWNLYYYPMLSQWWSFGGGVSIALANSLWISMALWYRNN